MTKEQTGRIAAFILAIAVASGPALADIAISGNVKTPISVSLADLKAMPQGHVVANLASGRGPLKLDCTGPALSAVLDKAQPDFGPMHNAFISHTLLLSADDNYAVALSLGEIDAKFGKENVILATDCNGKPLTAPRMVIEGDSEGARALSGVAKIEVK